MRVLSAPKRLTGLAGFGLEVTEYVEGEHDENTAHEGSAP
jgi:GTP cyclohydrolase II